MSSQMLTEGCFRINIPSPIYEYCHYLKEGSKMELIGINGKQGTNHQEAVTLLAEKTEDVLSLIILGSSMGSMFETRLADVWACDIQSATIEDIADETVTMSMMTEEPLPGSVPEQTNNFLQTDLLASPPVEIQPIPQVDFSPETCQSSPSSSRQESDLKISSSMEADDASSPAHSHGSDYEVNVHLKQESVLDLQEALEEKESIENVNSNWTSGIMKDEPVSVGTDENLDTERIENDDFSHADRNPLQCPTCKKVFKLKKRLETHQKTHSREAFQCTVCSRTFKRRYALHRHSSTHQKGKPYACSRCGIISENFSEHQKHSRTHTDEKPFKCTTCSKSFYQHSKLVIHNRLHTGERPFLCSVCAKGFIENSQLKIHSRIHTGEKPYLCDICDKGFSQAGYLQIHRRTHTGERPYKCKVCDVGFVDATHLKTHLRIHTGEKPYVCSICSRAFCRSEGLRVHMRNHTGEKCYICSVCGQSFQRSDRLKQHLQSHKDKSVCVHCGEEFGDQEEFHKHMETHLKPEEVQEYVVVNAELDG